MKTKQSKKPSTKHSKKSNNSLQNQLGSFVKARRGDLTFAKFGAKLNLSDMVVWRIEQGTHNTKLSLVQHIATKLGVKLSEIFSDTTSPRKSHESDHQ